MSITQNIGSVLLILVYLSIGVKYGEARKNRETKIQTGDGKVPEIYDDGLTSTPVPLPGLGLGNECSYTFKVSSLAVTGDRCDAPKNERRCGHKKLRTLQKSYLNVSANVFKLEEKIKMLEDRLEVQTDTIRKLQKYVYSAGLECDRMTGWIQYNGSCYWFSPRDYQSSWMNGNIICKSLHEGASLAVLNDEQEAAFVLAHADLVDRQSFWWIGCRKQARDWTCVDDSVLGFTRWSSNRPTSYHNDRCLQLWNLPKMEFTDTQCNQKWSFVCEKNINWL